MTAMVLAEARTRPTATVAVRRRLRPLAVGIGFQNLLLWVPDEKLFMTQIGFNAAAIGIVAAVYGAVVPVLEVPFGVLAGVFSARVTYFATVPLVASAMIAFRLCREPTLHRVGVRVSYRRQAAATLSALARRAPLRRAALLAVLAAITAQLVFEFGPLWLVSARAPAGWHGPCWAAVVSTVGLGAWLTSRVDLTRRWVPVTTGVVAVVAALLLVTVSSLPVVVAMQVLLALVAAMVGVRASFLIHEAVAAGIRAGVSSGASTMAWITVVPLATLFGWVARAHGVHAAGWLLVVVAIGLAVLLHNAPHRTDAP